eukprot:1196101-Prorocentrum_minimum.AAC.10
MSRLAWSAIRFWRPPLPQKAATFCSLRDLKYECLCGASEVLWANGTPPKVSFWLPRTSSSSSASLPPAHHLRQARKRSARVRLKKKNYIKINE